MEQCSNTLLMIRPVRFRMNEETKINNYYQQEFTNLAPEEINAKAQSEFDALVDKLRANGIQVLIESDSFESNTPDSIFPNNWLSLHEDGRIGIYPMFAANRRRERRMEFLEMLTQNGFTHNELIDFTAYEKVDLFLEGTGSLVLDRVNKKAYCALSPRSHIEVLNHFCQSFGYRAVPFLAFQTVNSERKEIYHTNVMLSIGAEYVIVCLDSVDDPKQKQRLLDSFKEDGKTVIEISEEQVCQFAGNSLQVKNKVGKTFTVMSQTAKEALSKEQVKAIEEFSPIISASIPTIEKGGGGSVRCMLAEVFLPQS